MRLFEGRAAAISRTVHGKGRELVTAAMTTVRTGGEGMAVVTVGMAVINRARMSYTLLWLELYGLMSAEL